MSKCHEVMTPHPASGEPGDSIRGAAETMKSEDVGALPVVDSRSSRRLVGVITDRDIVVRVVGAGGDVDGSTVKDAMTSNPASVREDEDVSRAIGLMAERKVRRIPVVDAEGRLVGIIAQADVATRVNKDKQTGELVEAISEPGTARR
jgi:CBS domain-containing protein